MNNKEIIKYFYEVVVSKNLLNELPSYISKDCVQKVGENETFIGIDGMRQHRCGEQADRYRILLWGVTPMYEYICTLCDLSSSQKEQETVVIYQR